MELAERYGDTKYKRHLLPGSSTVFAQEPNGVKVVCDRDIDPEHPAGTPLNDIFLIHGYSVKEYIESGYKKLSHGIEDDLGYHLVTVDPRKTPFFKYLNDIKKSDLVLMCADFYLFPPRDWPSGAYNLTVTVYGDEFELSEDVTYTVQ